METYIPLSNTPSPDGEVDFIVNMTKEEYVRLDGCNTNDTIRCFIRFMWAQSIWNTSDIITNIKRPKNFVMGTFEWAGTRTAFYNEIGYVVNLYNQQNNALKKYFDIIVFRIKPEEIRSEPMQKIYILQLEHHKFYVGKTNRSVEEEFADHIKGSGCKWTLLHKPIAIVDIIVNVDNYDVDKYTKIYMDKYGIGNVRGGTYSMPILSNHQITAIQNELSTAKSSKK